MNLTMRLRSTALLRAAAMGSSRKSKPVTAWPRAAKNRACSPVPQPAGISNGYGGTMTVNNSTLTGNTVSGGSALGAGISSGTATIINSTLSGNSGAKWGGAIYAGANLTINNTTITGNSAAPWSTYFIP